jgi:hypothetical protein
MNIKAERSKRLFFKASLIPLKKSLYDLFDLSGNKPNATGTVDDGPTEACRIKVWEEFRKSFNA